MGIKAVTIISGGMDSVTLAHDLKAQGYDQHLISFNYGQRHKKELKYAHEAAVDLGCKHDIIMLDSVKRLFTGSSLTDSSISVPEGHYAADTMKATIVPNRNAIMLSIAWGVAISDGADVVAYGAHAGDHNVYPDCRQEFVVSLQAALQIGTETYIQFARPYIGISKTDILKLGLALGVDYSKTWSCYQGGEVACGRCGTCTERLESFSQVGQEDPIPYLDREFWKTAKK